MIATPLYRQLFNQLSQWIIPKDLRHLTNCAEIVAAILSAESASLAHWIPYLSHRDCQARSHLARLSYFMHNPQINQELFYRPLIEQFLQKWSGEELMLAIDTSMFWDRYCLIEVCVAWGGRSITLAQTVIEHGSSTVGFEQYRPVLEAAKSLLPPGCQPTLLADRGFEHGELMRWLGQQQWSWAIRAKSSLQITTANGKQQSLRELFPPKDQVYLLPDITVLGDVQCNLGTANCGVRPAGFPRHGTNPSSRGVKEPWAVLTNTPLSLQTFQLYGQRFGGIEPHSKDYKSGTFEILRSKIRNAQALSNLLMMVEIAQLLAIRLGLNTIETGSRSRLDSHSTRGLSLLQLGIRFVKSLCHRLIHLPQLTPFPWLQILPAFASHKKRKKLDRRIEFSFDILNRFLNFGKYQEIEEKSAWIPLEVKIESYDTKRGDFFSVIAHIFACNQKSWDILAPLISDSVQLLPLRCDQDNFNILKVINIIDCLDYSKADVFRSQETGRILGIRKYAFKEQLIRNQHFFAIPEKKFGILVSQAFKDLVEQNQLEGLSFKRVA